MAVTLAHGSEEPSLRVLFDTSVLLPALILNHPRHADASSRLDAAHSGRVRLVLCTHAIAELYSTLTGLPIAPRIQPAQAEQLMEENILAHAELVALTADDYRQVVGRQAAQNLAGGVIYDALHVQAAMNANVDRLWTLNVSDFERVWPDHGGVIEGI